MIRGEFGAEISDSYPGPSVILTSRTKTTFRSQDGVSIALLMWYTLFTEARKLKKNDVIGRSLGEAASDRYARFVQLRRASRRP